MEDIVSEFYFTWNKLLQEEQEDAFGVLEDARDIFCIGAHCDAASEHSL